MKRLSLILTVAPLISLPSHGQQFASDLERRVALNSAVNLQQDARLAGLESDVSHLKASPQITHPAQHPHTGQLPSPRPPATASTHTVAKGDTFYGIARRHSISIAALQAANPAVDPARLQIGQAIALPTSAQGSPAPAPAPTPEPTPAPQRTTSHVVVAGDTLSSIARRHGTSVPALQRANGLSSDTIQIGQNLLVPGIAPTGGELAASPPYPAPNSPAPAQPSTPHPPAPQAPSTSFTHTVRPGETLSAVARQYGTSVAAIVASTPGLSNPNQLKIGQQLTIPGAQSGTVAAGAGAPAAQSPSPAASATPPQFTSLLNYRIRSGEDLDAIAQQFGTSTAELLRINGLASMSVVRPGDIILVPGSVLQAGHTGP